MGDRWITVRRPRRVLVVVAFLGIATVIALVVGIALALPHTLLDGMWKLNRPAYEAFQPFGRVAGVGFLFLGALTVSAAFGLMHRRRWAWWLAVNIFAVNGLGDVVGLAMTGDLLRSGSGVAIAGVFLFILLSRTTRMSLDPPA